MFDEGSHGNTENIPPHMVAQLQGSAAKQTGLRPQQQGLEVQSGSSQQGLQVQQAGLGVQSGVSGQTQQALDRSQSSTGADRTRVYPTVLEHLTLLSFLTAILHQEKVLIG